MISCRTNLKFGKKSLLSACLAAGFLAACTPPETILPGKREAIGTIEVKPTNEDAAKAPSFAAPRQSATASWPMRSGTGVFTAPANLAFAQNPALIWSTKIGSGNDKRYRVTASPVAKAGLIYTLDASATVTAMNTQTGVVVWQKDLTPPTEKTGDAAGGALSINGDKLFVTTGYGLLHVLDARTGTQSWQQNLGATSLGAAAQRGNVVYISASNNKTWALNATTGRIRWQQAASDEILSAYSPTAPVITDKLAVFGYSSGELVGYLRQSGLQLWSTVLAGKRPAEAAKTLGAITGDPVLSGSTIYAGTFAGRLSAINADNGSRIWTAKEGVQSAVWPAGDSLFALNDNNQLLRISKNSGQVLWRQSLPKFVKANPKKATEVFAHYGPIMAGGNVLVASSDGVIRQFNPQNGEETGTIDLPSGAASQPIIVDNRLYLVTEGGDLIAMQ